MINVIFYFYFLRMKIFIYFVMYWWYRQSDVDPKSNGGERADA